MGCGNVKEKVENEMIALKLERVGVQMERKKQIKLLEDMEGIKIEEPIIPDYIVSKPKESNNEKIVKKSEKMKRNKSFNIKRKSKNIKTGSTNSLDIRKMRKPLK